MLKKHRLEYLIIFCVLLGVFVLNACQQSDPQNAPIDSGNSALSKEDFDGDNNDDLAVGVPQENIGGNGDAGAVNAIYGSTSDLTAAGDQYWHQNSSGVTGTADPGDKFGTSLAIGDFDGNGRDDLAIGTPREEAIAATDHGVVNVLYSFNDGLTSTDNDFWHQSVAGVAGTAEMGDRFGHSLAVGDFDNDGKDDLAVGVPFEMVDVAEDGAVQIFYGSNTGLGTARDEIFHQGNSTPSTSNEIGDRFGLVLASGDFNRDGKDDLAIGAPKEDWIGDTDSGVVVVLYGSNTGLTSVDSNLWRQGDAGVLDATEMGDQFGSSLTACDFNGDGKDDLAIGASNENVGGVNKAGAVNILYGSNTGLTGTGDQFWHQDSAGIKDSAENADKFGHSLASGYFGSDGSCDLAIGVPFENRVGSNDGMVHVLYGSRASGITATGNQIWHQNTPGIIDSSDVGDQFGRSLTAGDFDGNGNDDLAIGVPYEDIGFIVDAGAVNVIYGANARLTFFNNDFWHQNSPGVVGASQPFDLFGWSLAARK